jgi:hypothetical protein
MTRMRVIPRTVFMSFSAAHAASRILATSSSQQASISFWQLGMYLNDPQHSRHPEERWR